MYGGSVISISTRERARCTLTPADRLEIESSGETAIVRSSDDLRPRGDRLDVIRAALTFLEIDPGETRFALRLSTEIPMQAGMAGSTALVVTLVGALDRHYGWRLHPWAIA